MASDVTKFKKKCDVKNSQNKKRQKFLCFSKSYNYFYEYLDQREWFREIRGQLNDYLWKYAIIVRLFSLYNKF